MPDENIRFDKFLWAVRLYKTRSQATEACKGGSVKRASCNVKPSAFVRVGDQLEVRTGGRKRIVRVLALLDKRVGASLVADYLEDLTPPEPVGLLEDGGPRRERGTGRPTKRDRRRLDQYFGS